MRKLLVVAIVLLNIHAYSQKPAGIPDYGTITPEDIALKVCDFDPDADAVVLYDYAVAVPGSNYELITERRVKIKILKESGIERGNIVIPYYSKGDFESIAAIEGYVYTVSSEGYPTRTSLDKKSIFRKQENDFYSTVKIAMPNVRVGSIIEYKYEDTKRSYSGLDEWEFQTDMPTLISHYHLTILPSVAFQYRVKKSPFLPIAIKPMPDEGKISFEMKNIASLRDEPLMDSKEDYRQKVVFQLAEYRNSFGTLQKYATSWEELARELNSSEYFGKEVYRNVPGADALIKEAKAIADLYSRMLFVYNYIRKNFAHDGYGSRYASETMKRIWDKKTGNDGCLNILLVNLLKEAGLDTEPVLVSERRHGKVDLSYPFEDQFNKTISMTLINGRPYFLDAIDYKTPIGLISYQLLNTTGFVVSKKKPMLIKLADSEHAIKNFIGIQSTIDKTGLLHGQVSISSYDYAKINKQLTLATKGMETYKNRYLLKDNTALKIDSLKFKNENSDSLPLEQSFDFSLAPSVNGDYLIYDLNLFTEFYKNEFVSKVRFTDINFVTNNILAYTQVITTPSDFKPETLPKSMTLQMPDKSIVFTRTVNRDAASNQIVIRYRLDFTRFVFVATEYPTIQDFYKKMIDLMNEPLVLKVVN